MLITLVLPYLPFSELLGFTPLPLLVMVLLGITALYVVVAEAAKQVFYARYVEPPGPKISLVSR